MFRSDKESLKVFVLDKSDVESAVMQFICACHPDVSSGHAISVYNHLGCAAVAWEHPKTAPQEIKDEKQASA